MNCINGKNILLFAPDFFGYDIEIKRKLEFYGAYVYLNNERPSNSFFVKAIIRIKKSLIWFYTKKYFERLLNKYQDCRIDYVFIIKGEVINDVILKRFKETFKEAKFILYLWDSIKNYKDIKSTLYLYDKKFTFDLEDAKNIPDLVFRPLFFIDTFKKNISLHTNKQYDLLFIGTVHSDRWLFLNKVLKQARESNLKVKYYLYIQSPILFLVRKLFDSRLRSIPFRYIEFSPLSKESTAKLIGTSNVIIDIQHPNQIGLTIRSIEVLGARKKLITTNRTIEKYDFFNDSNISIIDRNDPELDIDFLKKEYIQYDESIYHKYSIDGWLNDIFDSKL